MLSMLARADSQTHTIDFVCADGRAASCAPSSTRWGSVCSSVGPWARRLALGGVDDDDRAPARGGHGAQLRGGREARAAAPAQAGALDLLDQGRLRAASVPALRIGSRPVRVEVCFEAHRAVRGDARQQPWQAGGRLQRGGRLEPAGRSSSCVSAGHSLAPARARRRRWNVRAATTGCPSGAPIRRRADRWAAKMQEQRERRRRRRAPRRADARCSGQPPITRASTAANTDQQAGDAEHEQPRALHVAAGAEAVQQGDRPARVGQPVDRAPARVAHAPAQQARDRHGEEQVEGDRARAPARTAGRSRRRARTRRPARSGRSCRAPR